MLVRKNTILPIIPASELPSTPPENPAASFSNRVEEILARFRQGPVTPATTRALEHELHALSDEVSRQVLEQELNNLEPDDKAKMPPKMRCHKQTYRINKKTSAQVSTRFGKITLRSFYYLNCEAGEPGFHPLYLKLGIGEGAATPALAERVARAAVEHTQAEVRAWLMEEHGLKWTNTRLRAVLADFRRRVQPFAAAAMVAKLLAWLEQAEKSRGRHRPVLGAGRDGIMVPMWHGHYQEAGTGTVTVYDRNRRRLGTVYLGQMPESKQTTLSQQLTTLLTEVLKKYAGPQPRLVYVTDKGSAPEEYYQKVLKKMRDPQNLRKLLDWEWVLDFYNVAAYVSKMADALFGVGTKASRAWFVKMRHWLRHRPHGAANVERSAKQYFGQRERIMTAARKEEFWKAYWFIRGNQRWMDYPEYRRRGLPIGSGVTEAACKTVFTQRFKRSGMRWKVATGQIVLDLRTIFLSGVWQEVVARDLATRELPEPIHAFYYVKSGSGKGSRRNVGQMAA